jgi:hypothetical protein
MVTNEAARSTGWKAFLEDFRETLVTASQRLLRISEAQSVIPREEDKWSPKEITGHLIDSAANNHQRFVRAQLNDELIFRGYVQTEWVSVQHYNEEPWEALVGLWRLYNQHILHVMTFTPEETRMKLRARHNLNQIASDAISENEPVTLDYFMRDYVDHMKKHLNQILA